MTTLTELLAKNDIDKLMCELTILVGMKDYKTINTLLYHNPNTLMLNSCEINVEIPCDEKPNTKRKGVMKFIYRSRCKLTSQNEAPQKVIHIH